MANSSSSPISSHRSQHNSSGSSVSDKESEPYPKIIADDPKVVKFPSTSTSGFEDIPIFSHNPASASNNNHSIMSTKPQAVDSEQVKFIDLSQPADIELAKKHAMANQVMILSGVKMETPKYVIAATCLWARRNSPSLADCFCLVNWGQVFLFTTTWREASLSLLASVSLLPASSALLIIRWEGVIQSGPIASLLTSSHPQTSETFGLRRRRGNLKDLVALCRYLSGSLYSIYAPVCC